VAVEEAGMNYSERPWLKSYMLGPYKLEHSLAPYPQRPVYEILDQAARAYPNQTAILFQGKELKYHQLKSRVDSLANGLMKLGVEKGAQVCIYLPNCPEYVLAYWAVIRAGGVVVPTSILRTEAGLFHEVSSSNSRFIICQHASLERVITLPGRTGLEGIIITGEGSFQGQQVQGTLPMGVHDFASLMISDGTTPPEVIIKPAQDLCELAFTGGATGIPKGVMLSHTNRYASIVQTMPWFMKPLLGGIKGKTSVLLSIPMFHVYGIFIQTTAIYLGLRLLILPDARDTDAILASINEHRPFLIPGVPTQFMRLADAGLKRSNSMLFSGSAPLPGEVALEIRRKTGMSVSEGYGLTESTSVSHINLSSFSRIMGFMSKDKPGIGVPLPDVDCRLLDLETGEDVAIGRPGELVIHGPQIMRGYWPQPGSGLTSDGWLHTGDVAVMDDGGYFQIVDRLKDMVNVSGLKVYTTEVDEVLFKHPAIAVAAAFGIPDADILGSERVMAVVSLKDGYQGVITEQELRDFCRQHLPPYAVPKIIEFRDELPLTVTEKVFKNALREQAIANMKKLKEG
jgi:long-chain acyl-CoA synthetase